MTMGWMVFLSFMAGGVTVMLLQAICEAFCGDK